MKAIPPLIILVIGLLAQMFIQGIDFPGQQHVITQEPINIPSTNNVSPEMLPENVGTSSQACSDIFIRDFGFPFRVNNYDECRNASGAEDDISPLALSVNSIIWIFLSASVFRLASKK